MSASESCSRPGDGETPSPPSHLKALAPHGAEGCYCIMLRMASPYRPHSFIVHGERH